MITVAVTPLELAAAERGKTVARAHHATQLRQLGDIGCNPLASSRVISQLNFAASAPAVFVCFVTALLQLSRNQKHNSAFVRVGY
jgi:hypothetical protein